jgi:hypothetical protein
MPFPKTGTRKIHTELVHEPHACIFSTCTEPAKVSWEGTQLEVARGKKFCKAGRRIKNGGPFTKDRSGRGTGGLGISTNGQFWTVCNGGRSAGAALRALADDVVTKRIDAGDKRLAAVEWKSGSNMRIVDIVAPFGGEAEMREQLSDARG